MEARGQFKAIWLAFAISCIAEIFFRIVGSQVGGISPEGGGSPIGIILFLIHFPAIIVTAVLIRDPRSALSLPIEVGASIVIFTLVFWAAIEFRRWIAKRGDGA
jgi:hypothetical protein